MGFQYLLHVIILLSDIRQSTEIIIFHFQIIFWWCSNTHFKSVIENKMMTMKMGIGKMMTVMSTMMMTKKKNGLILLWTQQVVKCDSNTCDGDDDECDDEEYHNNENDDDECGDEKYDDGDGDDGDYDDDIKPCWPHPALNPSHSTRCWTCTPRLPLTLVMIMTKWLIPQISNKIINGLLVTICIRKSHLVTSRTWRQPTAFPSLQLNKSSI